MFPKNQFPKMALQSFIPSSPDATPKNPVPFGCDPPRSFFFRTLREYITTYKIYFITYFLFLLKPVFPQPNPSSPANPPFIIIMAEALRQQQLKKHEKLIEMIHNYSLSSEQQEYLRKIKEQTELQIAIRYLKSEQNKNYVFPLRGEHQQDEIQEFPGRVSFQQTFYDLCAQNFIPKKQRISKLVTSRRVKSLGPEKAQEGEGSNRVTERVREERGSNQIRLKLPKIQSSKMGLKSLQRLSSPVREQKKLKVKPLSKIRKETEEKESLQYGMLLTKKLLTEEEETIKIGVTKILINKRIHSPVKAFTRHRLL